jgi:hypothetical protein
MGTWEALPTLPLPTTLWHIKLNKDKSSFFFEKLLGHLLPGTACVGSSPQKFDKDIINCTSPMCPFEKIVDDVRDIWIQGLGHGGGNVSTFTGKLWYNTGPPPKEENAPFVKGLWTRDIAAASRQA